MTQRLQIFENSGRIFRGAVFDIGFWSALWLYGEGCISYDMGCSWRRDFVEFEVQSEVKSSVKNTYNFWKNTNFLK